jgi:hypothetical protein
MFDFVGFLLWYCPHLTGDTISNYISDVNREVAIHRGWRYQRSPVLNYFLKRWKQQPRERSFRVPATPRVVQAAVLAPDVDPAIRAAVAIGYHGALRGGEYTAPTTRRVNPVSTLRRCDVRFTEVGGRAAAALLVRTSKSDRTNAGQWTWILGTSDARTRPVRVL